LESFLVYYAKLGFIGLQKNYYNRIIAMAMARPIRQLSEGTESRIAFNVDGKIFWVEAAINHGGNLGLLFQFGIHAFKRKHIETEKVAWYSIKRKRVFYRHYAPTSAQP
jgi:hypothetical protein